MNRKEAQELFDRYVAGSCTLEERAVVERWYAKESAMQPLANVENLEEARYEMWEGVAQRAQFSVKRKKPALRIWITSAAAVLILISLGFYFYRFKQDASLVGTRQDAVRMMPGSNKAVLTLADGSRVILDQTKEGTIANDGPMSIDKIGKGQLQYKATETEKYTRNGSPRFNTISTPRGGQYHVVLSDGTGVWLNAASSIKFPIAFTGAERNVELIGEAYFEVIANASKPFNVKAGATNIRVLGTHFNVMAYNDEASVNTTLLEGKVMVLSGKATNMLSPGQQARALNGTIAVVPADTEEAVAWKKGYFYFKDADLKTVMRQISRWYDVDVDYRGDASQTVFSGKIYRNVAIGKMLEVLSYFNVDYKVVNSGNKGRKTIVIN